MNGRGAFKWPCGKSYEGEYKANKRHGFGVFSWSDGRKFMGDWVRGKQQGKGEFFNPETKKWSKGVWEYGKLIKYENSEFNSVIDNRYNVENENNNMYESKFEKSSTFEPISDNNKKFSPLQNDYNFNQNQLLNTYYNNPALNKDESYQRNSDRNNTATFNPEPSDCGINSERKKTPTDHGEEKLKINSYDILNKNEKEKSLEYLKSTKLDSFKQTPLIKNNDNNNISIKQENNTQSKESKEETSIKENKEEGSNKEIVNVSSSTVKKKKKIKKKEKTEDEANQSNVEPKKKDIDKDKTKKTEKVEVDANQSNVEPTNQKEAAKSDKKKPEKEEVKNKVNITEEISESNKNETLNEDKKSLKPKKKKIKK